MPAQTDRYMLAEPSERNRPSVHKGNDDKGELDGFSGSRNFEREIELSIIRIPQATGQLAMVRLVTSKLGTKSLLMAGSRHIIPSITRLGRISLTCKKTKTLVPTLYSRTSFCQSEHMPLQSRSGSMRRTWVRPGWISTPSATQNSGPIRSIIRKISARLTRNFFPVHTWSHALTDCRSAAACVFGRSPTSSRSAHSQVIKSMQAMDESFEGCFFMSSALPRAALRGGVPNLISNPPT